MNVKTKKRGIAALIAIFIATAFIGALLLLVPPVRPAKAEEESKITPYQSYVGIDGTAKEVNSVNVSYILSNDLSQSLKNGCSDVHSNIGKTDEYTGTFRAVLSVRAKKDIYYQKAFPQSFGQELSTGKLNIESLPFYHLLGDSDIYCSYNSTEDITYNQGLTLIKGLTSGNFTVANDDALEASAFSSFNVSGEAFDDTYYYFAIAVNAVYNSRTTSGYVDITSTGYSLEIVAQSSRTNEQSEDGFTRYDFTVSDLCRYYLNNFKPSGNAKTTACMKALGYYSEQATTLTVKYIESPQFGVYADRTRVLSMPNYYLLREDYATQWVYDKTEFKQLSDFNVVKVDTVTSVEGDSEKTYVTDKRIVRQATGYKYEYNKNNQATLTVEYSPFHYKDLFLRVYNNDGGADTALYSVDVYPIWTTALAGGKRKVTFKATDVQELCFGKCRWLVEFDGKGLKIDGFEGVAEVEYEYGEDGTSVTGFSLIFDEARENELSKVSMKWCAKIVPDKDLDFYYTYLYTNPLTDASEKANYEFKTVKLEQTRKYSDIVSYTFNDLKKEAFYNEILSGLEYAEFDGRTYAVMTGEIENVIDYHFEDADKNAECNVKVKYRFNPIVKFTNSVDDTCKYRVFDTAYAQYKAEEFYSDIIPYGYRIVSYDNVGDPCFMFSNFNVFYPLTTDFTFNVRLEEGEARFYVVRANLSDEYPVTMEYLKRFKDSPFATLETFNGNVKVADYDLLNLTGDDIERMIGEENVSHIEFNKIPIKIRDGVRNDGKYYADENSIKVTANGTQFNIAFEYSYTYIKGIDSDGKADYFNVKLTPFSKWCEYFGKDWTILALSDAFTYSDEVPTDKLYGFFTVMTFKEEVSNFNSWFKEYTASGACAFFSKQEIRGSDFYKFMRNNPALLTVAGGAAGLIFGGAAGAAAGAAGGAALQFSILSATESLNADNGTYYSYFLYLDGTTDKAYTSHNGATDYNDTESAFKNKIQNIAASVVDFFKNTMFGRVLKWILIAVAASILIPLLVSLIVKIVKRLRG